MSCTVYTVYISILEFCQIRNKTTNDDNKSVILSIHNTVIYGALRKHWRHRDISLVINLSWNWRVLWTCKLENMLSPVRFCCVHPLKWDIYEWNGCCLVWFILNSATVQRAFQRASFGFLMSRFGAFSFWCGLKRTTWSRTTEPGMRFSDRSFMLRARTGFCWV